MSKFGINVSDDEVCLEDVEPDLIQFNDHGDVPLPESQEQSNVSVMISRPDSVFYNSPSFNVYIHVIG